MTQSGVSLIHRPSALAAAAFLLCSIGAATNHVVAFTTLPRPARSCASTSHLFRSSREAAAIAKQTQRFTTASSGDNDRRKEDDKAKTYQVIMNHIADIEDVVEKNVGETSKAAAAAAAASSSRPAAASKSSKNPFKGIQLQSPTDGKNRLVFLLAAMTGVADVVFVTKYKNFGTMMTGNTMWLASHVLNQSFGLAAYITAVLLSYMAGLAIFRKMYGSLKEQSLELFAPMVTAAFLAADYLSAANPAAKGPSMCLLAGAYGIINSVGTDMAGTLCFVLTGHMTKITNSIVDNRFSEEKKKIDSSAFIRSTSVCAGIFLGALAGWASLKAFPHLLQRGILSLMGTIYGGLFLWQDAKNMGGWWKNRSGKEPQCEIDNYEANCE